jgi:hypothetical protein
VIIVKKGYTHFLLSVIIVGILFVQIVDYQNCIVARNLIFRGVGTTIE